MADPFANLLTSLKNDKVEEPILYTGKVHQVDIPEARKREGTPAAINGSLATSTLRPITTTTLQTSSIQDTYDDTADLFGLSNENSGTTRTDDASTQQHDDLDDIMKAFDDSKLFDSTDSLLLDEVVDEVKDMEIAKLMSLGLSIQEATNYYAEGILYDVLNKDQQPTVTERPSSTHADGGDDNSGFFSNIINKGKKLVDQLAVYHTEDGRMFRNTDFKSDKDIRGELAKQSLSGFDNVQLSTGKAPKAETYDADLLGSNEVNDDVKLVPLQEDTLLDFGATPTEKSNNVNTTHTISHIELSGYNEFKDNGNEYFKQGDYVSALNEYEKSWNTLPPTHPLRIISLSNIMATQLKLGQYKQALNKSQDVFDLFPASSQQWNQQIPNSDPTKSFKEMWYKIMVRRAESFEHEENYENALESYKSLMEHNFIDEKVMNGKRRCQKIINPPAKPVVLPEEKKSKSAISQRTVLADNNYENVAKVRERDQKQESIEKQKLELHDQVEAKIQDWQNGKSDDIRYLLANLHQVLTWCGWEPIAQTDLVMPKRVKVSYMRAMAKTHPDKIQDDLDLESKLIAECVFSSLSLAWEKFKTENGMN